MKSMLAFGLYFGTSVLLVGCHANQAQERWGHPKSVLGAASCIPKLHPHATQPISLQQSTSVPVTQTTADVQLASAAVRADLGSYQDDPNVHSSRNEQSIQEIVDDSSYSANSEMADPNSSIASQPVSAIDLEDLLALAFANNPAIQELAATTQIAAGYRTQVGLYANPLVGYQGQQLADEGTDQHLIFVQQQIITGGKLGLNRTVLNEAVRAQLQELEAQKLRVATDIKIAYYDCLRIQEQLLAIEQFSNLLQQGVTAAQMRMQAGEGSKIDLLQTQVQFHQLDLDRRQLAVSLNARLREIVSLAGVSRMYLERVSGQLPNQPIRPDWKALEDALVASSPEYAAAQARIRQAIAAIRRHESQPLPNLAMELGAGVDNSTNSGMINVQVGAPIPVFNKNQGNIVAARAEYCRTLQEARRIDNAIRARLAVASGEYDRASEAVTMYTNHLLPAAQETLDLAEDAYRVGEQDFVQLLVTRRTYFDSNLAYIAACAQLATAQAQIDGYLLTGALNSVINNSGDDSLRGLTFSQE